MNEEVAQTCIEFYGIPSFKYVSIFGNLWTIDICHGEKAARIIEVVVFFVRGCEELEETKACNAANALELIDASEDDIKEGNKTSIK